MSQSDFGSRIGATRDTIANIEMGRILIRDVYILAICREFNVNEDWLRYGTGEEYVERTENQKIASFVNDVMGEDDTFRKRFLEAQASLTDEDWLVIEKIVDKISKK